MIRQQSNPSYNCWAEKLFSSFFCHFLYLCLVMSSNCLKYEGLLPQIHVRTMAEPLRNVNILSSLKRKNNWTIQVPHKLLAVVLNCAQSQTILNTHQCKTLWTKNQFSLVNAKQFLQQRLICMLWAYHPLDKITIHKKSPYFKCHTIYYGNLFCTENHTKFLPQCACNEKLISNLNMPKILGLIVHIVIKHSEKH